MGTDSQSEKLTGLLSPPWDRFVAYPPCGHQFKLDVDFFDLVNTKLGRQFVPDDLKRLVCSNCGSRGAELLPASAEAPLVKRSNRTRHDQGVIPDAHEDWWSRDRQE